MKKEVGAPAIIALVVAAAVLLGGAWFFAGGGGGVPASEKIKPQEAAARYQGMGVGSPSPGQGAPPKVGGTEMERAARESRGSGGQ